MSLKARRNEVRKALKPEGFECLLVTEAKNRRYLSGFTGSSGWLVITADAHHLITDGRYWDQVARQCPEIKLFQFTAAEHESLSGALLALLEQEGVPRPEMSLGVETTGMTLSIFRDISRSLEAKSITLHEVEGLVGRLRECKDTEEVALMRRAAEIADQALAKALSDFGPGRKECELKALIEFHILSGGGEATSFPTIVASGPNGALPHAGASERVVNEGELITIDFGAVFKGYCSDMTRTIWYGELPARRREILAATREAQSRAVRAVKEGVKARELDAVARDYLESQGLGQYFIHSLGHGVGLDIHEAPGLRKTNEDELKVGQVVTVEPGVYIPGDTGCRVEDTVVVTERGCDVLNSFPKQSLDSIAPDLPA